MIYTYRCPECSFEKEVEQTIHKAPPATIETNDEAAHPCSCTRLKRVWTSAFFNLGFREHHHTREEQFQFKNL